MSSSLTLDALRRRRTQYALGRKVTISPVEIESRIKEAIRLSPSSFNSQSSRALILFGRQSERFWELTAEILRGVTPAEAFPKTADKMRAFAAGVGTVLFFEDQDVVKGLQQQYPLYAEHFPSWSEHSAGMAQLAVWTTLAEAGIGASLQHYVPLTDEAVQREWDIPAIWKMRAQMPFGSNEQPFPEKSFIDDAERFRVAS